MRKGLLGLGLAGTMTLAASAAYASNGLDSPESGVVQAGRGGAWLARADDPLAIYFNPAGLVRQSSGVHLGAQLLFMNRCYTRTGEDSENPGTFGVPVSPGNDYPGPGADPDGPAVGPAARVCGESAPSPTPQLAFSYRISDRFAAGVGLIAPHGVGTSKWPTQLAFTNRFGAELLQPAPNRYQLTEADSRILFPMIGASFAITDELSVGASFTWGLAFVEFVNFAESISQEPASTGCGPNGDQACPAQDDYTRDVRATLSASDIFIPGLVVGALWSPHRYVDVAGWFRWSDAVDTNANVRIQSVYWNANGEKNERCDELNDPACDGKEDLMNVDDPDNYITPGEKPGDPGYQAGKVYLNIPMEAKLGVRFHYPRATPGEAPKWAQGYKNVRDPMSTDLFDISLDFTYANNSSNKDLVLTFKPGIKVKGTGGELPVNSNVPHEWRDVFGVRVGGDFVVLPSRLALRAGGFYESRGQDPQYLNLDFHLGERIGVSGGATVRLGPVDVSVAYQHTFFGALDNGGQGKVYALTGDNTTANKPAAEGGPFRSYQAINGGKLESDLNEVGLAGSLRF